MEVAPTRDAAFLRFKLDEDGLKGRGRNVQLSRPPQPPAPLRFSLRTILEKLGESALGRTSQS